MQNVIFARVAAALRLRGLKAAEEYGFVSVYAGSETWYAGNSNGTWTADYYADDAAVLDGSPTDGRGFDTNLDDETATVDQIAAALEAGIRLSKIGFFGADSVETFARSYDDGESETVTQAPRFDLDAVAYWRVRDDATGVVTGEVIPNLRAWVEDQTRAFFEDMARAAERREGL